MVPLNSDPSLTMSKNSEDPQNKDSSPNKALDDKVSSLQNPDDDSRPTSAPPKLYSGSLFLYSNDLYEEYFTREDQDLKEEDQYNKFFNLPKSKNNDIPLTKGMSYQNGESRNGNSKDIKNYGGQGQEATADLELSRQNSESIVDPRLSPDSLMESQVGHKEGKQKQRRKSKSHNSPKKVMENQNYSQMSSYTPMMMGQNPYMMRNNQQQYLNVNMNINMMSMSPEFNYMMNERMYGRGMMGYPVPVVNYYPYGMYPQTNMQMPQNYGNNYMPPGPVNTGNQHNHKQKHQDSHKSNSGNNAKHSSHNKDNNAGQYKNNSQKGNKDKEKDRDRDNSNQNQKREKRRDNNTNNTSSAMQAANLQSLNQDEQEQLIEDAVNMAKDQGGCRLLQQKLETNDPEAQHRIFEKVIGSFDKLMIDPFGNYFCQKIAETCDESQMKRIIEAVSPSITSICLNPHGTRAVQKLIEIVKTESLVKMLAKSLSADVVGLVKDNHGNHVVQKCLTNMSESSRQFIYDSITENCVEIATHKHGCCVMQRCLDHASKSQKNELVRVIANNTLDLVEDQYGNYVVQYILELKEKEPDIHEIVAESLIGHVVELSKQKFSSNVIEKCLQLNIPSFRLHFMELLANDEVLVDLVCDQFGNYVIQRCLNNADEELKTCILDAIYQNAQAINQDPFGNKIYTKLAKNYNFLGENEATSTNTLSPRASEGSNNRNQNKKNVKNTPSNKSNNSGPEKSKNRNNKNNEKKNNHAGGQKNSHSGNDQNSMNYSNRNQKGHQRNSIGGGGGQVMYSHPVGPEMMAPTNMGNPMMSAGYYMPQPQMYGQFYGYPQMQPEAGYNGRR